MRDLEEKEKELNKLKVKADGLVNNNHPASDKIEVSCLGFIIINRILCSGFVLKSQFYTRRPTWTPYRPSGAGCSRSLSAFTYI